jgi:hypothetical protein
LVPRLSASFALILALSSSAYAQQSAAQCQASGSLTRLPGLSEASGLAVSRRIADRLYSHNDSGQPTLFALDTRGAVTARVRITGAKVQDWEALAVGPCGSGSCLYVADIGDNEAKRRNITVYRIPEPAAGDTSVAIAETISLAYPDGAQDAEALFVSQDGVVFIVTKGETGSIGVYRAPSNAKSGGTTRLERVGTPLGKAAGQEQRITDAAISPDGEWVALRSRSSIAFYRASDFVKGQWKEVRRVDLTGLREPQGEGIALGPGSDVYLAGEGGGKSQPGTFVRFTCELKS